MLLSSFIFLFLLGFVSAFGTKKNSPEFRGCFVFETAPPMSFPWESIGGLFQKKSLHSNRLSQIARLVNITATHHSDVIGQNLQRHCCQ